MHEILEDKKELKRQKARRQYARESKNSADKKKNGVPNSANNNAS